MMIIDSVKKRKSGTITINYTEGGKLYGLTLTAQEIVELHKATNVPAQEVKNEDCKHVFDGGLYCIHCGESLF